MAITNATTPYNSRPSGNVHYTDYRLTAASTGVIQAGSVVMIIIGTGTLRFADDVAASRMVGIAADTTILAAGATTPAAGDRLRVIRRGAYVWLPDTTDTLTVAHIEKPVFIDDGGNAQKVEVVNGLTNITGMVGFIVDFGTAEVLVDTAFMGTLAADFDT